MDLSFIIIDDTELDHFIAKKMIANKSTAFRVLNFLDADLALEHIAKGELDKGVKIVLVLLDIYMPLMDGFQFVEAFEKLQPEVKEKYYIVALTSSIAASDINKINSYRSFKAVITKPITADDLTKIINKISAAYDLQVPE